MVESSRLYDRRNVYPACTSSAPPFAVPLSLYSKKKGFVCGIFRQTELHRQTCQINVRPACFRSFRKIIQCNDFDYRSSGYPESVADHRLTPCMKSDHCYRISKIIPAVSIIKNSLINENFNIGNTCYIIPLLYC